MFRDLQQQYEWHWPHTISSPLTSSVPSNGCRLISNINQHNKFLSLDQQSWGNSAMASSRKEYQKTSRKKTGIERGKGQQRKTPTKYEKEKKTER
jgi:threonine synthase